MDLANFENKIKHDAGIEGVPGLGAFLDRLGFGFGVWRSENLNFLNNAFTQHCILGEWLPLIVLDSRTRNESYESARQPSDPYVLK